MDDKTLTALQASIKHWEENYQASLDGDDDKFSISAYDCALCGLFNVADIDMCAGCPVAEAGNPVCRGTPYEEAAIDAPKIVLAELDLLKSLLPDRSKP